MNYRNWMRQEVAKANKVEYFGRDTGYTTGGSSGAWEQASDTNSSGVNNEDNNFFFNDDDDDELGDCQFFIPNK